MILCTISIQERFIIKSGLWWRAYGNCHFFDRIKNINLKDDIEGNKKEIIIIQTNLANNKEAIEKNDEKIGSLSDKAASFKTDIDNNKDDIKTLESEVTLNSKGGVILEGISIWSNPQVNEPNHCPSTFFSCW